MPSLGSILQIAKTGLIASHQGLNVTSHNIANATTEGYSRQRAHLVANPPIPLPSGVYGTGVSVQNVQRVADPLLEGTLFRELGAQGEHGTRAGLLARAEALFGEPSDTGLAASLDALLDGFSQLAANPTSAPVRAAVRQAGVGLSQRFHELAGGLDELRQETEARLVAEVDRVNVLTAELSELNRQIVTHEVGGLTAGDLRDEQGRRLAELADLVPIRVSHRENGSIGVEVSGMNVVDGVTSMPLELRLTGGVWGLYTPGGTVPLRDESGSIGGLLDVANTDLPGLRQDLDDLAAALVTEVNAIHTTGTNQTGTTGIDFFDPAATTATSIGLSADVAASADVIAAGTPDGLGAYRAGANDVALALAGLRAADAAALGMPIGEFYDAFVLDVGAAVRATGDAAAVHGSLAEQAEIRRQSLSGVSVDEELVKLIEFQTAYQASARVVTTADEVLQTLVNM